MRQLAVVLAVLGASPAAADAPLWPAGATLQLSRSDIPYDGPANAHEVERRAGMWRVDLSWPAAANATTYRLLRNGRVLAKVPASPTGGTYQHSTKGPFRYTVQAGDVKGGWSLPLDAEFREPPPSTAAQGGNGGGQGVSAPMAGFGVSLRGRIPGWKAETVEENAAPQFDPNRVRFAFDFLGIELTRCEALQGLAPNVRSIELRFALDAANGKIIEVRSVTLSPENHALNACAEQTLRAFRVPRVAEPGAVAGTVRLIRSAL